MELTCAGFVRFKDDLWVGVERQFACQEPIYLSATNSGALEYSVDASDLKLLGRPGQPVSGQRIAPEDAGVSSPRNDSSGAAAANAAESAH